MTQGTNSWSRLARGRYPRCAVLRAAGLGAGSLTAAAWVACSSKKQPAPAGGAQSGNPAAGESPRAGGTLNVALASNTLLDPHLLSNGVSVMGATLSRPFRFKSALDPQVGLNNEIESDLALSAESPDGITWTIKLRSDVRFQDIAPVNGHPVEAEDVKATLVRAATYAKNPNRGSIGMINPDQIQAPAKDTVVFKLNYPYAPFPRILASTYAWILPREAVAGSYDPETVLIGSGPFILDTHQPDVAFTFKKNPAPISISSSAIPPQSSSTYASGAPSLWRSSVMSWGRPCSATSTSSTPSCRSIRANGRSR